MIETECVAAMVEMKRTLQSIEEAVEAMREKDSDAPPAKRRHIAYLDFINFFSGMSWFTESTVDAFHT